MPALRRILRSSAKERRLVIEAALLVPAVRGALSLLPFRWIHRKVGAVVTRWKGRTASDSPENILWAVRAVSARVPGASCLTQALAATMILARHGHQATLRVGATKDDQGRLRAHAWLEIGGTPVLGEPAPGAFVPFPPLVLS